VPAEIELKLALDAAAASRAADIARHPAVALARRGRTRTMRVVSTYYDTPDYALEKAGVSLRLRREGSRWLQTVKGPPLAADGGALHAHDEQEWRLSRGRLDLSWLAQTPWHKVFAKAQASGLLAAQFATDVVRRTVPLAFPNGTTATLAIDTGAIRSKQRNARRVPIAEIEIELENGNDDGSAAPMFHLALALLDDWPLSVATATKASRGYALVRGDPDSWREPVHAGYIEFDHEGPAEAALRAIAQECARQIAANAPGLLADADPEWVHQMRIGTRRLRSCLSLIESITGPKRIAGTVAETRWLAGILGAARDWDVLADATMAPLAEALAKEPAATAGPKRLFRSVGAHRSAARKAAQEGVQSMRFQRLLLAIGALCAEPLPVANEEAATSARAFAEALLAERHRKLLERGVALEDGTPEERHAVRIAAKKLRYAAEFFSPPDPGKRNRAYLKALSRLQDALGDWHDAATATRLMSGVATKPDHATVGAVRGWTAARAAALEPELTRAWRRFAAAKRFWTRG
jgi:inorganic triphosphatase YgiF